MRKHTQNRVHASSPHAHTSAEAAANGPLDRALRQIAEGHYERALSLLEAAGRDLEVRNARGVCLLRLARHETAIGVLRDVALQTGCTWVRKDAPICYGVNYATALLLGGHPAGCLEVLADLDRKHPSVQRLHAAVRKWEQTLGWWSWLNWKFGRIEPEGRPISLEFTPGEFAHDVTRSEHSLTPASETQPRMAV